jgi:hypothetical protein
MRPRGLNRLGAAQDDVTEWALHLPSRVDGSPVMIVGDRRPTSSLTFAAAVRDAIGFGRGVYLPATELECWRHRDPGGAAAALARLASALYEALGPASYWAGFANGNAGAVRRDGSAHPEWLRNRASDWRQFADSTDPDLARLATEAADALDALANLAPLKSESPRQLSGGSSLSSLSRPCPCLATGYPLPRDGIAASFSRALYGWRCVAPGDPQACGSHVPTCPRARPHLTTRRRACQAA